MRKLLTIILLLGAPAFATDWYASSSSGEMSTRGWYSTAGAACTVGTGLLTWASRAAGDIFHANSCTAIAITTTSGDPGANGKVTLSTVAGTGTAGGGFTCATATGPATLNTDITAGTTVALTTTGSTGTGCNVTGNLTGGSTSSMQAVSDAHTIVTLTYTGNSTAGSASSAAGLIVSSTGPVTFVGNAIAGASSGAGILNNSSATVTMTGDCVGSDTQLNGAGCSSPGTGVIIVTGNLRDGLKTVATIGYIRWTPAATNYRCIPKDASFATGTEDCTHTGGGAGKSVHAIEAIPDDSTTIGTVSNVKNAIVYGTYTGTLTSTGGSSGSAH